MSLADVDAQVDAARRAIRQAEESGDRERIAATQAYLSGLLTARGHLVGFQVSECQHPRHRAAGLDERERTIWQCVGCGDTFPHRDYAGNPV